MNAGPLIVTNAMAGFIRPLDGSKLDAAETHPVSLMISCGDQDFCFHLDLFFADFIAAALSSKYRDDRDFLAAHGGRLELLPGNVLPNDELTLAVGEFSVGHNNENNLPSLDADGMGNIGHVHNLKDTLK